MDKATAVARIAARLAPDLWNGLTWAQFVDGMTGLDAAEKAALLAAVKGQNEAAIGRALLQHTRAKVRALAAAEATARLSDDALSLTELDGVL